jgi:O-antigen/teichoic acid export membrane protein
LQFAANSFINIAYNRVDMILVAALTSATQLAIYAPASRLQDALYLLPGAVYSVALPAMSQLGSRSRIVEAMVLVRRLAVVGFVASLGLAILVYAFIPQLLDALLGPDYSSSASAARIMVWSLPLAAIGSPLLAVLVGFGHGTASTRVFAAALMASVILNLALDPLLGASGAALAAVGRDVVFVVVAGFEVMRLQSGDGSRWRWRTTAR